MHNATEGFGIAAPLRLKKIDWKFLALAGFVGGAPTFFGTVIGSFYVSPALELLFLSLAAGSILYIVGELIHIGKLQGQHRTAMIGLLIGFFIAYGSDLFIEVGMSVAANRQETSKTIYMEASEYKFIPSTLRIVEGDTVRIIVKNTGKRAHEFKLRGLGVETAVPHGKSVTITVRPGKAGIYEMACNLPGHLEKGMRGELVVKAR